MTTQKPAPARRDPAQAQALKPRPARPHLAILGPVPSNADVDAFLEALGVESAKARPMTRPQSRRSP